MGINRCNFITRDEGGRSIFPSLIDVIDATISFEQGDLLFFDTSPNLVKVLSAETDTADFLGISNVTLVFGKIKQPYATDVDASQAIVSQAGPLYGVVALLEAKGSDAFNSGDLVGADPANLARGVSVTVTTKSIGVYQGKDIASATQGQLIEVLITAQFPFAAV